MEIQNVQLSHSAKHCSVCERNDTAVTSVTFGIILQTVRNGKQNYPRGTQRKKVFQWELAHELGIFEQTMVRKMRFEMDALEQSEMLTVIYL